MEMRYLWRDSRPGHSGEPAIDKNRPGAKHEKQEKVRGLIWGRLLIRENATGSSPQAVTGVLEGTFSKPRPIGEGKTIAPKGKTFKWPMAIIGHWKNGVMDEACLFRG
jgi:hypothetical protein